MHKWVKISWIILILCTAGCTKDDDLSAPVRTNLMLRLITSGPYQHDSIYYRFTGGWIGIDKIEFEGVREAGDNVFFNNESDIYLPASKFTDWQTLITEYELPQGIYKYIRMDMYLRMFYDEVFLNHQDADSPDAGFMIKGAYERHYWKYYDFSFEGVDSVVSIPFIFQIDHTEKFVFRTLDEHVIKKPDSEILLSLDLANSFKSVDYRTFEKAEITGDSSDQKIIISSNSNRNLYEILLFRLGTTTRMSVY